METKDWVPLIASGVSFVAALLGGWLGGRFAGRNERDKLLRDRRVTAAVDLVTSVGRSLHLTDQALTSRDAGNEERFKERVKVQDEANAAAWSAYHRLRLLGPEDLVVPVKQYWQKYRSLQSKLRSLDDASGVYKELAEAEERFHAAVGSHVRV